jgi:hypothetical protein
VRLVLVHHGDGEAALQLRHGGAHGLEQVALVQAVHEVGDDFRVGLAGEDVAARLELRVQLLMVLDDAVVHQRHAPGAHRLGGGHAGAVAEMRMRVVHRRRAVRRPARVRDAGRALQATAGHLLQQLRHARGAARTLQAAGRPAAQAGLVHGHAAGIVAAVFEPLQALDEKGNDVARGNRADDAAHGWLRSDGIGRMLERHRGNYRSLFL